MTYPWAGFGTFLFRDYEKPLVGTDRGWVSAPTESRTRPLGAARDHLLTMGRGSDDRRFEIYIDADHYDALLAMVGTVDTLTGWRRPIPDSRSAKLVNVEQINEEVYRVCGPSNTLRRAVHCAPVFVSQ